MGMARIQEHYVYDATKKIITAFVVPNKSTIFATNMTSHASHRTAHPGRSSSFYVAALNKID